MRWIVATSLRFRYVVAGLAIALLYVGTLLIGHQKLDVFPEFAPVSVEIQTACLGLSPSEVEALTTVPLEAALHGVPGVYDIRSSSEPELSAIFLYFRGGTDVLRARQLVQERLQTTAPTLPTWCDPPQLYPIVSATSRVMQIGLTSRTVSPEDLSMIAQWTIRPRLMRVPGVANVAIWGQRPKQIMVEADPALMAAHGVTLDELMTASADAVDTGELRYTTGSAVGSLGVVETPQQGLYVHSIEPIATPQQMAQVPVAEEGHRILRVGQVAQVAWGSPPLIGDAVIDGGPGLMLVIEKFPGANTLQVTAGIDQALAALAPGLDGIHVDSQIFRQASFIETAIHNLSRSVLLGCILVVFVLIAFLFQWQAALVSLLAIPLSLAVAGIVFEAAGATINTMILAGFAVAVGVVVDDAIIDMENIVRRLRGWRAEGKRTTPARLVLAASLEVRVAIFYATLINIVAVVPVMLVGGLTGAFFEPLAIAYGLAVLASMAVALTVTPALGLILLQGARLSPRDPPLVGVVKRGYAALLKPVLRAPRWAFLVVLVAVAAGVVVYPRLGQDLFPSFKEPDFLVHFVTKPGTSVQEEDREVTRLQDQVLAIPGVSHTGSHIGQALLGGGALDRLALQLGVVAGRQLDPGQQGLDVGGHRSQVTTAHVRVDLGHARAVFADDLARAGAELDGGDGPQRDVPAIRSVDGKFAQGGQVLPGRGSAPRCHRVDLAPGGDLRHRLARHHDRGDPADVAGRQAVSLGRVQLDLDIGLGDELQRRRLHVGEAGHARQLRRHLLAQPLQHGEIRTIDVHGYVLGRAVGEYLVDPLVQVGLDVAVGTRI